MTDLLSYYNLPSTIVRHPVHKQLKAAYAFYNVPGKHSLVQLMTDALVLAKEVSSSLRGHVKASIAPHHYPSVFCVA